jgi:hypothetical protein
MVKKMLCPVAAVTAALLAAAPAAAATDYTGSLSAASTSFAWDGGPGNGIFATSSVTSQVGCDKPGYDCETLLLNVETPGALAVKIEGQGANTRDIDLHVYQSDASGKQGKLVGEAASDQPVEQVAKANAAAGHYLVVVDYYIALAGTYKGTATLKPPAGAAAAGASSGPANLAPEAKIATPAAGVKVAKLKGFRGTASDDKGVGKVEIGLVRKRGSKCHSLGVNGRFARQTRCDAPNTWLAAAGASKWTFELRRRLAKGRYVLFARAIDTDGQAQTRFTPANRRAFTVK